MPEVTFPHKGMQAWTNPHGIRILKLHYSADEEKTPEWAAKQKAAMISHAPEAVQREYLINEIHKTVLL